MTGQGLRCVPLTADAFAPFGAVIEARGQPRLINAGRCERFHGLAALDVEGEAGISLFRSQTVDLPYEFDLVERHPLGSQAFVPMTADPFLVVVAPDEDGTPGTPRAFITNGAQAIQFHRNAWHGVLTPLSGPGLFAVIDRTSEGSNLEEFRYPDPWRVVAP